MLQIEYSWVLFALPLPFLVWWLLPASASRHVSALCVPFYSRFTQIRDQGVGLHRNATWRWWLGMIGWVLLVLAASNPLWLGQPIAIERSGRALILAVDLSGSMKRPDMLWQNQPARRIDVVKIIGSEFISQRRGDRIGLILFGSNAYLQAPLTFDRETVKTLLQDSSVGLAGTYTAIGDAIGLALKRFKTVPDKDKVLVLLTDGVNNAGHVSPEQVTELAKQEKVRIYTIGLGANQMQTQTLFGATMVNPSADLDEKGLQKIAEATGGLFFRATSSQDLRAVYQALNRVEPTLGKSATVTPKSPLYPYLLIMALCLGIVLLFPKRSNQYDISTSKPLS